MKFMGYDSPLISLLTKISQLLAINILWILCTIPIFTVGASSTAMYAVTMAMAEKRGGNVPLAFLREFKRNFRDGELALLPMAGIFLVLGLDLYVVMCFDFPGWRLAAGLLGILAILFLMVWALVFPLAAKYQSTPGKLIRSAFVLALQNFYKTLFMALMNVLPVLILLASPRTFLNISIYWVLLGFAVTAYLNSMVVLRILKKNDRICGNGLSEAESPERK